MALERVSASGYREAPEAEHLRVTLTPSPDAIVTEARAQLEVFEAAETKGSEGKSFKHVLATSASTLRPTEGGRYEGLVALPMSAPGSFDAPNNRVKWELRCHIGNPSDPDWQSSVLLQATPIVEGHESIADA